jgi:pterin-4a-carbinolamine dehydratase
MPEGWRVVERPPSLFRRFEFAGYDQTRLFLDRLAALSASASLYPDLGFGKTYVNVTIHGVDGALPGAQAIAFAGHAAELAREAASP